MNSKRGTAIRLRILIVDSTAEDRETYCRFLNEDGGGEFDVTDAACGEEGLDVLRCDPFDCVLLSDHLPDIDGWSFLEVLNEDLQKKWIPVVMLIGQGSDRMAAQGKSRVVDYLIKGAISASTLKRAVHNAIEKCRLQRTIEQQYRNLLETNQKLGRQQQELQEVLNIVNENLRGPMSSISALLNVLQESLPDGVPAEQHVSLKNSIRACRHMSLTLDQLTGLLKIGQTKAAFEEVELESVVRGCVDRFRSQIDSQGVHVEVSCPDVRLVLPRARVDEALHHLLENALKHGCSDPHPRLVIEAAFEGSELVLSIADNGGGIAPKDHGAVFEMFRRLHPEAAEGTGVGLATVRRLIENVGGRISLDSDLGAGAKFQIHLPIRHVRFPEPASRR